MVFALAGADAGSESHDDRPVVDALGGLAVVPDPEGDID